MLGGLGNHCLIVVFLLLDLIKIHILLLIMVFLRVLLYIRCLISLLLCCFLFVLFHSNFFVYFWLVFDFVHFLLGKNIAILSIGVVVFCLGVLIQICLLMSYFLFLHGFWCLIPFFLLVFLRLNCILHFRLILLRLLCIHFVPVIMCSVKIGEELSAAALTRGLGGSVKRTNICEIGFHVQDILFLLLCVVAFAIPIATMIAGR